MAENQNYSELTITFADFINKLDRVLIKDNSEVDFMLELVDHALQDGAENPFRKSPKSNLKRYLRKEKLSKPKAKVIAEKFNKEKLAEYLQGIFDDDDNEDGVNELCEIFFPTDKNVTFKNLAQKLSELFRQIVRNRIMEIDFRPGDKSQKTISLADEKDLEEKIKQAIKALFAIKDEDEIKEISTTPVHLKNKIPDNYLLFSEVHHEVTAFFQLINQCFTNGQREGEKPADFILKCVNSQYKKLKETTEDKDIIFSSMVQFFLSKAGFPGTDAYKRAACCVVSYFVQLCEVFDATAE